MNRKNKLDPLEVGRRIKEIRGERTLDEFGRLLGVKNPTVYRYETDRIPGARVLLMIAGLDPEKRGVDWILTGQITTILELTEENKGIYKDAERKPALPGMAWNEPPEMYTKDPRRQELLHKVKKLIVVADDKTINALDTNVDEFLRHYIDPDKRDPENN